MSAVEHFKTLCCLGLPPQPAMIALSAAVREVIPAAWTRMVLYDEQGAVTTAYAEHGDFTALAIERYPHFAETEPSSIAALMLPAWRAAGVGWTLPRQNADYFHTGYYAEIERPVDGCWILDGFGHDGRRSIAGLQLSRPRSAKPFRNDDVALLESITPWFAHAFRDRVAGDRAEDTADLFAANALQKATVILDADGHVLCRTAGIPQMFMMLNGSAEEIKAAAGTRADGLPTIVQRVVRALKGTASGDAITPPRARVRTSWGTFCLEAVWLAPAGAGAADIVADRRSARIAVNIELREHIVAHAARVLRESGASPAQMRIGVLLATGRNKPQIAQELGIKASSVIDATRKLYARLNVRNTSELAMRFWAAGNGGTGDDRPRH